MSSRELATRALLAAAAVARMRRTAIAATATDATTTAATIPPTAPDESAADADAGGEAGTSGSGLAVTPPTPLGAVVVVGSIDVAAASAAALANPRDAAAEGVEAAKEAMMGPACAVTAAETAVATAAAAAADYAPPETAASAVALTPSAAIDAALTGTASSTRAPITVRVWRRRAPGALGSSLHTVATPAALTAPAGRPSRAAATAAMPAAIAGVTLDALAPLSISAVVTAGPPSCGPEHSFAPGATVHPAGQTHEAGEVAPTAPLELPIGHGVHFSTLKNAFG